MYLLGIDCSTVKVGIAITDLDCNIFYVDCLKLDSRETLESRALIVRDKLKSLPLAIECVYIEAPLLFSRSKSTAHTLGLLNRFNGMVSILIREIYGFNSTPLNPNAVRGALGIKIPKMKGIKPREKKQFIIDFVYNYYKGSKTPWSYEKTRFGNPAVGTDDIADALALILSTNKKP